MGVENIITFDAHDPRVQNSIPLHGFETVQPAYQFIKGICKHIKDLQIDSDHMMIISPDEGGTNRAVYLANVLHQRSGRPETCGLSVRTESKSCCSWSHPP